MEKAYGQVDRVFDDMAEVLIERGSMCGENCSSCGMCDRRKSKITVKNTLSAKAGDKVVLSLSSKKGLKAAILAYFVPVLILIMAVVILLEVGLSEGKAVLLAFIIMAMWFFGIFIADKKGVFKEKISAEMVSKEA